MSLERTQTAETVEAKAGRRILIEEDSARDGVQIESIPFSVEERVRLVDGLSLCGFFRIQVGSFVHPEKVAQMARTEEVFERIRRKEGVVYSALVLNRQGLERAVGCGVEHVSVYVSASETHSRKNADCTVAEAGRFARSVIEAAGGLGIPVRAGIMNAFGCRFEGAVPFERVLGLAQSFAQWGADEINLADTPGLGNPRQVEELLLRANDCIELPISLHLHDTFGFALANIHAAFRLGVRRFDACCGGLGGCPFIPGAAGNVPTEDVVHLFESIGEPTGIDPQRLLEVVRGLEDKLGRKLNGKYGAAWGQNAAPPAR